MLHDLPLLTSEMIQKNKTQNMNRLNNQKSHRNRCLVQQASKMKGADYYLAQQIMRRHSRGRPPRHQTLCCFQMHITHLYIPSATTRLPAVSGQPGVEWLSATVDLNVFLQHARNQSPGKDWLFAGDGMTATSDSIGFHYRALQGQLQPWKRKIRRGKTLK